MGREITSCCPIPVYNPQKSPGLRFEYTEGFGDTMRNILGALLLFSTAVFLNGQTTSTSILGTVNDSTGAVVTGAKVTSGQA